MSERDERLIAMIDRLDRLKETAEDRAYLVSSLAYGNLLLEDPTLQNSPD
jgi:hypothetical protein